MKLIIPILFFAIMAFPLNLNSQESIEDEWITCNVPELDDSTFFKFFNDTVFIKILNDPDFENFTSFSTYTINEDTIIWKDLPSSGGCPLDDIGIYQFTIQNDSLSFVTISEDCDERVDVLSIAIFKRQILTSLDEEDEFEFEIFPNPVVDYLRINQTQNANFQYQIFDYHGQSVLEGSVMGSTSISLIDLKSGLYILQINSLQNNNYRRKNLIILKE